VAKQQEWIDFAVREYVDNGRIYAKDLRLSRPERTS
jgi:hypothetical protein